MDTLIDGKAKDGTTPLLLAILLGHDDLASFLIDIKANINLCDNMDNAPIHMACYQGNLSLVQKLIAHGASIFRKTKKGNYPLALAVNEDKKDVVRYLVDKYY